MIDMNDFRYFVNVVDRGGFTAASKALQVPTSTLSHRVKQLEDGLGITLLLRTSRQVALTDAGAEFYRHAVATVERADEAENAMRSKLLEPTGLVRYTTAIATAQFAMPDIVNSFLTKYPKVQLLQHAVDQFVDIVAERYDVAIRGHTGPLPDSALVQRPLARVPWYLYASPEYLERHGEPRAPRDLHQHTSLFMIRENVLAKWQLKHQESGRIEEIVLSPRLQGTCLNTQISATKAGFGIAALPAYICNVNVQDGTLVRLLPEWVAADTSLTALMPNRKNIGAAARAFIDHLAESFAKAVDCT